MLIRKTLVGLTGDADANITYESVAYNGRLSAWAERQCRLFVGLIGVGPKTTMSWLQSIKRALSTEPEALAPLRLTEAGFSAGSSINVSWASIAQVRAFKLDLVTTDEVRFLFDLSSGSAVEISEEQPGFDVVLCEAQVQFPSLVGWQGKIIQPAFGRNDTTLYQRSVQLGAQADGLRPPLS